VAARFAVGVDLGTTNTVVAFAPLDGGEAQVLDLPQWVAAGEVGRRELLPSTLYAPLEGEPRDDPFGDAPWVVGELARRRATEVAGRSVVSSKSWLVHAGVDREAAILPWGAEPPMPRISPVDAAARLLGHVKAAWDAEHPGAELADQEVVLTVPASFDEVARELTVQAATHAGLAPKLLEEPQAAFYDWMARAGRQGVEGLLEATGGKALVLVVDVGGGTTDLSLVRVTAADRIERLAVGPHLLLGGDNMDLALAHAVEPRLLAGQEERLDPGRFAQLVGACRAAKEALMGESAPDDAPVTVLSAGAKLLGGARTTRIAREESERIVLDGFLPLVPSDARPQRARSAFVGFGLPFERDPAITRHVAAFVGRCASEEGAALPNALLLNGGVFRAARIAGRLEEVLAGWRGGERLLRLPDADPDLAVARGAVAYALARAGRGLRIGGGVARGYFVGVADEEGKARAVCVVPRGAEEGVAHTAGGRTFALALGRPVRFELFASDRAAVPGDVVEVDEERFARLPPVATRIEGRAGDTAHVTLEGELTAVGTLDLACVSVDASRPERFRLAFQLREGAATPSLAPAPSSLPPPPSRRIAPALDLLERAFGKPRADATGREAKDLLRDLEKQLGERAQWTTETNRALFDAVLPNAKGRRRSLDHERVFWLLAGYCARPGFGDPRDAGRVSSLYSLFDERLAFPAEARGWQQFWIAWRRVAGGLREEEQTHIRDFVDPYLGPPEARSKKPKKPALSLDDALDMAASLERVDPARRAEIGGWLLERTWTDRDPRLWAAIGRLGARVPAYASVHHVVPPYVAERWIDHLLREKWAAVPTAVPCAVQLARRTGDRARDIGDRVRREVEQRLVASGADEASVRAIREVVAMEEKERAAFFGEALPLGLKLVG
jgi:molecular chaperone DnaK (HSP70)